MYYFFNTENECIGTCTGATEPIDGITVVYSEKIYNDISLLRLVDGKIVEVEPPIEAETPTEATT